MPEGRSWNELVGVPTWLRVFLRDLSTHQLFDLLEARRCHPTPTVAPRCSLRDVSRDVQDCDAVKFEPGCLVCCMHVAWRIRELPPDVLHDTFALSRPWTDDEILTVRVGEHITPGSVLPSLILTIL